MAIQDFQGGAPTPNDGLQTYYLSNISPENCMKNERNWAGRRGGGGVPGAHLHPPLVRSGAPRKMILTNGFKNMKNFGYEQPGDGEHH